jgi:sugar lactone lactonase YvrE
MAKLEIDAKAELGEGAIWHPTENKLYWINIEGKELHIFNAEDSTDKILRLGERVGTVVPVADGGALVALQTGIHFINTQTGDLQFLVNPLPHYNIRFNDGKCDAAGRFWVGSMHLEQTTGAASLYRMDIDGSVHKMLDHVSISNGITWSADNKTMYYVDSPLNTIDAFDYDINSGAISNRRVIATIDGELGGPDGMTIDEEGKLWVALWGGNGVGRFDPATGKLLQKIDVPAPHIASCTFGGKNLDILYITSAREGMSEQQLEQYPLSGGLFSTQPGVKGVPAAFYKGNINF